MVEIKDPRLRSAMVKWVKATRQLVKNNEEHIKVLQQQNEGLLALLGVNAVPEKPKRGRKAKFGEIVGWKVTHHPSGRQIIVEGDFVFQDICKEHAWESKDVESEAIRSKEELESLKKGA